jgi:uncharacterized membrane protein
MNTLYRTLIIMIAALIGLVDALYLFAHRISGEPLSCGASGGCNIVAASPLSVVFGIPLSLLGIIFYFGIIVLLFVRTHALRAYLEKIIAYHNALKLYATAGLLSSAYFTYLQAFVINAWCRYCILSAITTCIIFIFVFTWKENEVRG